MRKNEYLNKTPALYGGSDPIVCLQCLRASLHQAMGAGSGGGLEQKTKVDGSRLDTIACVVLKVLPEKGIPSGSTYNETLTVAGRGEKLTTHQPQHRHPIECTHFPVPKYLIRTRRYGNHDSYLRRLIGHTAHQANCEYYCRSFIEYRPLSLINQGPSP